MRTTYVAGDLATVVTADGVVLTAPDRLAEVVELGERGLAPLTVAHVLSRGALEDLPDFVAVTVAGHELRVVVRGAFAVRSDGFVVDGVGVETWTEVSAPLVPGADVEVVAVGTTLTGPALPLAGGVVRSGGVRLVPEGAVVPGTAAPVAPAAEVHEHTVVRSPAPAGPAGPAGGAGAASRAPAAPPSPMPTEPPPAAPPAPWVPAGLPTAPPPPAPPSAPPPSNPPPTSPMPTSPPPSSPPGPDADHDGRTITPAQLEALRAGQVQQIVVPTPARASVAIQLSNGRRIPIRRRVLIGRSPRVQQVSSSANLPALITVDDPYVSGTHLEVSCDDGRLLVTDTSTNGTLLSRQGRAPVQLRPGAATEVAVGDVLTLSKGLTATLVPAAES